MSINKGLCNLDHAQENRLQVYTHTGENNSFLRDFLNTHPGATSVTLCYLGTAAELQSNLGAVNS